MTSWRQFQANRLNALKSTGPRTEEGKRTSRRNALRHGLTAETVIDGLEDGEDYRGFEAAIIADYDAETAVERELVLRLASLLWRLRRIIAIETDASQVARWLHMRQTPLKLRSRSDLPIDFENPPEGKADGPTRLRCSPDLRILQGA
jgi:hypothetical protein